MKESKPYIIAALIVLIGIVFTVRLFLLQVVLVDYKIAADDNTIKKEYITPYRGHIMDRNGKMLVNNTPVFDLYITTKKVKQEDVAQVCKLLNISRDDYEQKLKKTKKERGYSSQFPVLFIRNLSHEEYAHLQDRFDFEGFSFKVRTERYYPHQTLAHGLGYIAEIDKKSLDKNDDYQRGNNIGKSGIEKYYETVLRGKTGLHLTLVDVKGVERGKYKNGKEDVVAESGLPLISSIDLELQMYVESLLANKRGAAVAIEPSTGEVLCFVSSPFYAPSKLSGKDYSRNMRALLLDGKNKPLFNRAVQTETYAPGSTFKPIAALIALQEGVITPQQTIPCFGKLRTIAVNDHAFGNLNVKHAIRSSSNVFFGKLFMKTVQQNVKSNWKLDTKYGLEKWKTYVNSFGIGVHLASDIYGEKAGFVPDSSYYNKKFGSWNSETIFSLGIGQGELGITPLQSANAAAIIANRGYYYTPHIIKEIGSTNDEHKIDEKFTLKNRCLVNKEHFEAVIDGMEEVVTAGTARRSLIPGIKMCGKTGTVQNPHGEDNSAFIAFAPRETPTIAISVYVENGGGGSAVAAPIASLAIEKYIRGNIAESRKYLEKQILNINLLGK